MERAPDPILCDVDMPFMDGYEFVSALRADPATGHILVIFLTVSKSVGHRAKQLGAAHLMKPVMADELLRTVPQFALPAQPANEPAGLVEARRLALKLGPK